MAHHPSLGKNRFMYHLSEGPVHLGFTRNNCDLACIGKRFPDRKIVDLKQIHGATILTADSVEVPGISEGDGLIAQEEGFIPVIRTADCIPLFFWHKERPYYGVLHIGWRGFVSMIQRKLLDQIVQSDLDINDFSFYIGPAICSLHYPVGEEVIKEFAALVPISDIARRQTDGRFLLDVKKALKMDLNAQGIKASQVREAHICTFESPDLPSYRRQKNGERIFNFITRG